MGQVRTSRVEGGENQGCKRNGEEDQRPRDKAFRDVRVFEFLDFYEVMADPPILSPQPLVSTGLCCLRASSQKAGAAHSPLRP